VYPVPVDDVLNILLDKGVQGKVNISGFDIT
jgi:hypothetical protein